MDNKSNAIYIVILLLVISACGSYVGIQAKQIGLTLGSFFLGCVANVILFSAEHRGVKTDEV